MKNLGTSIATYSREHPYQSTNTPATKKSCKKHLLEVRARVADVRHQDVMEGNPAHMLYQKRTDVFQIDSFLSNAFDPNSVRR